MLDDDRGGYDCRMASPRIERPDLPEYMTWEELERLPEEIAEQIELWNGRVVWVRRGPGEHQFFSNLLWAALLRCSRKVMSEDTEQCWRVVTETNIHFDPAGKSDFVTPDFLVHRCLGPYEDVRATDVFLAGEVLSPGNRQVDIEAKKSRYADAGIPWYWEVHLVSGVSAVEVIRAYGLQTGEGRFPADVHPLHRTNYILIDEWTPEDRPNGIEFGEPFPINIPWSELAF
ncbi:MULTISPECIES: Uma2 family endonuclease [unclassified Nocardia]|uniref:Uma2 family endonuclease n=1 Tax=unclassified Nocardia TaxID=2637762 RepID=UPI0027E1BD21|nr:MULTISPECIES: Uma2 family endonuclease [unclassified Nocardia]